MLFWFIVLAVSIISVFSIPIFKMLRPEQEVVGNPSENDLQSSLDNIKDLTLAVAKNLSRGLEKKLALLYNKSLLKIRSSRLSGLVRGRGILKQKNTSSDFLRDVKDHKDKVREELANGVINREKLDKNISEVK